MKVRELDWCGKVARRDSTVTALPDFYKYRIVLTRHTRKMPLHCFRALEDPGKGREYPFGKQAERRESHKEITKHIS
jgi:hypothetical protein